MPSNTIAPIGDNAAKRKEKLQARWEELYQAVSEELKHDLENPNKDVFQSVAASKLAALVYQVLGMQFQEAKSLTTEWLRTKGIKELSNSAKPGWKQGTALAVSTVASVAGAVFGGLGPLAGLTGSSKAATDMIGGIASAGGSAGQNVTSMMHSLESSKHTTLQFAHELTKRTAEDQNDARKKLEEMVNRQVEELRRLAQIQFDTTSQINR